MNKPYASTDPLSSLVSQKIAEIIDVIIYKVELVNQNHPEALFIDLPLIHPGYPGIDDTDANMTFKILTKEFEKDGFIFPIQGIERKNNDASWNKLVKKLNDFKKRVLRNNTISKATNITNLKIVAQDDSKKYLIVVNDDFSNPITADRSKPSWKLLYDVAENKEAEYSDENKSNIDYFNSNKECRLYSQTNFQPTKILYREQDVIRPFIKIEMITEKAYRQKLNGLQKAA